MMNVLTIFKNDFYRFINKRAILVFMIFFIPLMIFGAVYFTNNINAKANIALISKNNKFNIDNKSVKIEVAAKEPEMSDLVLNKYDAVIIDNGNGTFKVKTIKSDKFKNSIEKFLKDPGTPIKIEDQNEKRGVGTNILGFLIMIAAVCQIQIMLLFPEDRDFGTFKRMLISPLNSWEYIFAQGLFNFIITFVPIYAAVAAAKFIFKISMGFGYLGLAGLLSLLIMINTGFALFIASIFDDIDNASSVGSFIVMFASVISGSFYSFTDNSKILSAVVKAIPYKPYLTLVQGIENGKSISNYSGNIAYIFTVTLILFALGVIITRRNLDSGKY